MENPSTGVARNFLNAPKETRYFKYVNYVVISLMAFVLCAAFSGLASAGEDHGETGDCNLSASNDTEVHPDAAYLVITKDVSKHVAAEGDVLTYTLLIRNIGNHSAFNAWIYDDLPDGFDYVAGSWSHTAVSEEQKIEFEPQIAGNELKFTIKKLYKWNYTSSYGTPRWNVTITYNVTVGSSANMAICHLNNATVNAFYCAPEYDVGADESAGSICANPTVGLNDLGAIQGNASYITWAVMGAPYNETGPADLWDTETVCGAKIVVTKTVNNETPEPGAKIYYNITVLNTGNASLNVTLLDVMPTGIVYTGVTNGNCTGGITASNISANNQYNITVNLTSLLNGSSSCWFQINATVTNNASEGVCKPCTGNTLSCACTACNVNYIYVTGINESYGTGPNVTTTVTEDANDQVDVNKPHIVIAKGTLNPYTNADTTIEYLITVSNLGDGIAYNVTVDDVLPTGFNYTDSNPIVLTDTAHSGVGCNGVVNATKTGTGNTHTFPLGNLSGGSTCQFKYNVTLDWSLSDGIYINTAKINGTDGSGEMACGGVTVCNAALAYANGSRTYSANYSITACGSVAEACGGSPPNNADWSERWMLWNQWDWGTQGGPIAQSLVHVQTNSLMTVNKDTTAVSLEVNDTVNYTIIINNEGNKALKNVNVSDSIPYGLSPAANCNCSLYTSAGVYSRGCDNETFNFSATFPQLINMGNISAGNYANITCEYAINSSAAEGLSLNKVEVESTDSNGATLMRKDVVETIIKKPHVEVEKWASDPYAEPGDTVTYHIKVRNTGTGMASNIHVLDALQDDANGGYLNYSGGVTTVAGTCSYTDEPTAGDTSFDITLGNLAGSLEGAGQFCEFMYTVNVENDLDDGMYVNIANVTAQDLNNNAIQSDSDEAYVTILSHAGIYVTKERVTPADTDSDIEVNETVVWEICVTNTGDSDMNVTSVVDSPPDGFNVTGDTHLTSLETTVTEDQTICQNISMTPMCGASESISVNKVVVLATDVNGKQFKDEAMDHVFVRRPHLDIDKWLVDPKIIPNSVVTYVVEVRNTGTGVADNVVVVDDDGAADFEYYAESIDHLASTCNVTNETGGTTPTGIFNISDLQGNISGNGEVCRFTFKVYVPETTVPGSYMNLVTVSGTDADGCTLQNVTDEAYVTVTSTLELLVTKSVNQTQVQVDDVIYFDVLIENKGDRPLYNVTVTDTLPTGYTFLYAVNATNVTRPTGDNNNMGVWNLSNSVFSGEATLNESGGTGDTVNVRIYVEVSENATCGPDENYVGVTGVTASGLVIAGSDTVNVELLCPNLVIEKWTTTPWVSPGDTATFQIRIKNVGTGRANDVRIIDEFISTNGFYFNHTGTITPIEGDCVGGSINCSDGACDSREEVFNVTMSGGNMNEIGRYEYCIFEYNATTPSNIPDGMYTNLATVNRTGVSLEQSDEAYVVVMAKADGSLNIEKIANTTTVEPGGYVNFTINLLNTGENSLNSVNLTDNLPEGWELTSYSSNLVSVSNNTTTQTYVFNLSSSLSNDTPTSAWIVAYVNSTAACSSTENKLRVDATATDGTKMWRTDKSQAVYVKCPELDIKKEALDDIVAPGDTVTYQITVRNIGTGTAYNVNVLETLPTNWVYAGSPTFTECTSGTIKTAVDTYSLQTMNSGDVCTFNYTVHVPYEEIDGTFKNTAIVSGNDGAANAIRNDTDYAFVDVLGSLFSGLPAVYKTANDTMLQPGDHVTFTINLTNIGDGMLYDAVIKDLLPNGFVYSGNFTYALSASDSWPMFHHDATHAGYSLSNAPNNNNTYWTPVTPGSASFYGSPAIMNGKIFIGSTGSRFYAINENNGSTTWTYNDGPIYSSPAVSGNLVFFSSSNNNFYALNQDGTLNWSAIISDEGNVRSSPTVANGRVYVGSDNGSVYAFNTSGTTPVWSSEVCDGIGYSSPAVADNMVFIGCKNGSVVALNENNGSLIWSIKACNIVDASSPTVVDGRVYIGCTNGSIAAINENTGALLWTNNLRTEGGSCASGGVSTPAFLQGKVYASLYALGSATCNNTFALDAYDGSSLWEAQLSRTPQISTSPVIADGKVFVAGQNVVYGLNANTGSQIWNYTTTNDIYGSPAVADGILFIADTDKIYAFINQTPGITYNTTDNSIIVTLPQDLNPGQEAILTLDLIVTTNSSEGQVCNNVLVTTKDSAGDLASMVSTSACVDVYKPKLQVEKWCNVVNNTISSDSYAASTSDAAPGDTVECFIKLTNMGTGDIRNVTVIDTMPPGWKYLNYTNTTIANWNLNPPAGMVVNGSNATGSIGNNYVNFTNISLSGSLTNGGDVRLIRYTAYINDNVTEGINWNCVNATGLDGNNTLYTAAANHCIPMNMHKPLLEITKSVSQHDVEPGSEPVVTIIIENPTYAPVYNVTITDFMPRGFNYTSGSAKLDGRAISDPNITGIEDFACGELVDGQLNLTWNLTYDSALSVIPPKTTVVLTFKTHVKCNVQAGNFNNTANVSGVTGAGAAVGPNSTFFEMKGYLANATLTKYASNNAPTYFEYVDYTIVIWNNPAGANIAPLTLADVMPPYLKYVPGYTYVGDLKLEPAVCGDYTDKTTASPITNVRNDSSGVNCTGFNGTLMDAAGNKFNATETQGDGTGQVLLWNLSKWLFLTPGQQVSIKYRTQVIPGIKGTARNNVTLSYLDPEHPDLCLDCLFDISGSSIVGIIGSPPVESEATYTLNLNKGWNLISIPVKPTDTSISAVLAPIAGKYTDVAAWNGNWEYLSYAYGDWFGNLAVIEPKKGYWLYMNEPAELKVTGTTDYDRSTTLYYGWNLIGSTSTQPVALNTALASIEGRYIDVATWNNGQWVYRSYAYGDWFGDLNTFEPGKGYWLNIAKGNSKLV